MKITPKQRESAAIQCNQMACWWANDLFAASPSSYASEKVSYIVRCAGLAVEYIPATISTSAHYQEMIEAWLEAEALLRSGWTP